ncbi:MAG: TIGR00153 family protein [Desulfobulbaceae bacterium]|uniref:TIGR00153 family protein n=1 Tax=Candidatus Desulfatifera sulfidica TaxID=2841691 RepID=A0A8J6N9I4_9BACT|nr:TIGR00153 family protein [Candidatus Desulfatifera sulfidica]
MNIIRDLIGKSPFGPIVEHTKKVHECLEVVRPLIRALIAEDFERISKLQSKVSRLEYEADEIKHALRDTLTRRYFLPVDRSELDAFIKAQENMADYAEDIGVILTLRKINVHPTLHEPFIDFINQVYQVSGTLLTAAVEFKNLAEVSFGGAESRQVMQPLENLGEEEWKADKMARTLSRQIYALEDEVKLLDILFYEKILLKLSAIANEAENAGDYLRAMISKG